jgi:uncharacterized membrane protein
VEKARRLLAPSPPVGYFGGLRSRRHGSASRHAVAKRDAHPGRLGRGIVLYLALIYWLMAHASIDYIRGRACTDDEGAIVLLVLTSAASLASLAAVIVEFGAAPTRYEIVVGMGTILLSWAFMHTIFALHYAHEFYGEGRDDRIGGLVFPGDQDSDYWDFLYYSLVVAMTAQVSDVQITSKVIRRLTTVHGVISFFFNVAVLALTVNMVSSLIQPGR